MDILDQINAQKMGHIKIITAKQAKATYAYMDIISGSLRDLHQ
jgi:hypothetical protein